MIVLAIDPGSSCGFAVGDALGAVTSGTWQLAPARGESQGMRYIKLLQRLNQFRDAFPELGLIVYEMAHQRGAAATEYAIGYATHIQSWCTQKGIEYANVHSATLKKWATGKGNASKDEMVAAGRRRFKPTGPSDDEIDALWIHAYAHEVLCGTSRPRQEG